MGRYYNGDIEGKFWFAVQSSDVGERFGCVALEQPCIDYYTDDVEACKEELERIEKEHGEDLEKFQKFFEDLEKLGKHGYNDQMLIEAGCDLSKLSEYADYHFGKKLLECLEKNGECNFTAEL